MLPKVMEMPEAWHMGSLFQRSIVAKTTFRHLRHRSVRFCRMWSTDRLLDAHRRQEEEEPQPLENPEIQDAGKAT